MNFITKLLLTIGVLGIVLTATAISYFQGPDSTRIDLSNRPVTLIETDPFISGTPFGSWGDFMAFGQNGEVALVGSTSILVSDDGGKNWNKITGGMAEQHSSVDGGGLTQKSKTSSAFGMFYTKKLCYVEGAQIISETKTIYIKSACGHSAQLWSVPLSGESNWSVWVFPPNERGGGLPPVVPFRTIGSRVLIRGLVPHGGSNIFTTDDGGNNWYPFWEKGRFDYGATDFTFFGNDHGWILRDGNKSIISTRDGGRSWSHLASLPTDKSLSSIIFLDEQIGFVVGEQGLILRSSDGGKNWDDLSVSFAIDFYNAISDGDFVWISGNSPTVIGIDKSGEKIVKSTLPVDTKIYRRLSVLGDSAFFVDGTKIYRFSAGARGPE